MPNLSGFTAKFISNEGILSEYNVEYLIRCNPSDLLDSKQCKPGILIERSTIPMQIVLQTFQVRCSWYSDPDEDLGYVLGLQRDGITMCGP
jgi:hypothetical protein